MLTDLMNQMLDFRPENLVIVLSPRIARNPAMPFGHRISILAVVVHSQNNHRFNPLHQHTRVESAFLLSLHPLHIGVHPAFQPILKVSPGFCDRLRASYSA